jgi:hypothetical protein
MRAKPLALAALAVILTGCTIVEPGPPAVVAAAPAERPAAYCREYTTTATIDGKSQQTVGTACQQPDGRWQIVSGNAPSGEAPAATAPTIAYPTYAYYPNYYPSPYYYPYPYYYGPAVSLGFGFRFGDHGHRHH